MKRIALGVQYDGSPFCGYQKQPNKNTVQDHLELALAKFTRVSLPTTCAGRTDTGVHALEQVVHFDTDLQRDLSSWVRGVNAFLPDAIAVRWAHVLPERAGEDFHARFGARSRTYHYVLFNHPVRAPLVVGRAGWVFQPLDVEAMHEAAQALVGTHDFTTFRAAGCQARTAVKNMYEMRVERRGGAIVFTLRASAFLHHMVRNIVGSLIYIGQGRQPVGWMRELVDGANRHVAAPTFMPDGLYLAKIDYDAEWALPHDAVSPLPWF